MRGLATPGPAMPVSARQRRMRRMARGDADGFGIARDRPNIAPRRRRVEAN